MTYALKPLCDDDNAKEIVLNERSIYFGNSAAAQVRLSHDLDLSEPCAKIWVEGDHCLVQNLTKFPEIVTYNRLPVYSVVGLEIGDQLQVIHDRFLVAERSDPAKSESGKVESNQSDKFEGKDDTVLNVATLIETMSLVEESHEAVNAEAVDSEPSEESERKSGNSMPSATTSEHTGAEEDSMLDAEKITPRPPSQFESTTFGPVVCRHVPANPDWSDTQFIQQMCKAHPMILFADLRRSKRAESSTPIGSDSLKTIATEQVHAVCSLHAFCGINDRVSLQIYESLKDQNAAMWGIAATDYETCLAQAELVMPWLARPSVLEATLQSGPPELVEQLLLPFQALILKPKSEYPWALYTRQQFAPASLLITK